MVLFLIKAVHLSNLLNADDSLSLLDDISIITYKTKMILINIKYFPTSILISKSTRTRW
jgi:hypothetical protein